MKRKSHETTADLVREVEAIFGPRKPMAKGTGGHAGSWFNDAERAAWQANMLKLEAAFKPTGADVNAISQEQAARWRKTGLIGPTASRKTASERGAATRALNRGKKRPC